MAAFSDAAFARDTAFSIEAFDFGTQEGAGLGGSGRVARSNRAKITHVSRVSPSSGFSAPAAYSLPEPVERELAIARIRAVARDELRAKLLKAQLLNDDEAMLLILLASDL
jgi:hypothetical protein